MNTVKNQINHKIIKMLTGKNQINHKIIKMLTGKQNYNLENIKYKIINGAIINNFFDKNNTLSCVLIHTPKYIKMDTNKQERINHIIELIKLLINFGALPSNRQANMENFSVNKVVKISPTKSNIGLNPINSMYPGLWETNNLNTLTLSVMTGLPKIVKCIRKSGAFPDNSSTLCNTFIRAIMSGSPEIVEEIIFADGIIDEEKIREIPKKYTTRFIYTYFDSNKTFFDHIYESICDNFRTSYSQKKLKNMERIIELMMCIGMTMCSITTINDAILHSPFYQKIQDYKNLLNYYITMPNKTKSTPSQEIIDLLKRLKKVKDDLIIKLNEIVERQQELYNAMPSVPTCCIDIVIEYQRTNVIKIPTLIHDWKIVFDSV